MIVRAAHGIDLGPLTWVKTEIEHSLAQARENLDKVGLPPGERAPVKYILTHLHQATGALAMVGLGAATRFSEELEKLVASIESCEAPAVPGRVAAGKRAIGAISGYLDGLLAGGPDRPMVLLDAYLELSRARGSSEATEGDLFHPDLDAALPRIASSPVDEVVLAKGLAVQRAQYQQGLLKALRSSDKREALGHMQAAIAAIESLQAATPNRPFWSAAAGFFDALAFGGLDDDPAVRPLFARVDQQVRQLIEGSPKVSERLFRDLLLQVGRARPVTERIAELKKAYRLDELLARPAAERGDAADDAVAVLLRELRDLTAQQKDTWLKYTSGNRAALEPFGKQALVLAERGGQLPRRDIQLVLNRLTDVAPALKARAIPPSETQALEVATAFLFVESALENYFRLGEDFERQARAVAERVKAAMAGEAIPPMDTVEGGLLDEMTRRAQEKLLVFQVGQEVQVNLQGIEQALDAFFRDAARRPDLKGLPAQFAQVQGALMIMELDRAAGLNAAVMSRVQQFAEGTLAGVGEAAEQVAEGLSALGLYVTAIQQGAARPEEILLPALVRFGLAESPAAAAEQALRRTGTVAPIDLELGKQKVQALYEDWRGKPAGEGRERLERAVDELKRDAAVIADAEVARRSEEALEAIQKSSDPSQTGVFRAIEGLAPDNAPQTPAPQVVHLVDAPGAEIDRELLEIFLEEAQEVCATIAQHLATCRAAPHDRESLTTIRRGFHTLKGSGRMVGLTELGEVAWQCEQVLNKWLKDEKPATPGLLDFVAMAGTAFGGWIASLKAGGEASVDGAAIAAAADRLKSGEEPAPATLPVLEPVGVEEPHAAPAPSGHAPEPLDRTEPAPPPAAPVAGPGDFALDFLEPAAAEPPPAEAPPTPEAPPRDGPPVEERPADEKDLVVGPVVISPALYSIYLGEAGQHVATLERELASLEADPLYPVSHEFMRAAHTLTSSSRTTGFEVLAELASALEKWLADAIDYPPVFDADRLSVTRRAVEAAGEMVRAIAAREWPAPRPDIVAELGRLRESLQHARGSGEGTHVRPPQGLRLAGVAPPAEAFPAPTRPAVVVAAPEGTADGVARPFEAGKDQRKIKDDVDRDLLPIFLEEAREILPAVSEGLRRWKASPEDRDAVADLRRHLHTLKGSARMTGLMRLGELAHLLEARVVAMDAAAAPAASEFEEVEERVDRCSVAIDRLARGEDFLEAEPPEVPASAVFEQQKDKPAPLAVIAAAAEEAARRDALPPELRDAKELRTALLRVNADLIDDFVNEAGELSIARSRIELEIAAFKRALVDLSDNVARMRAQVREIEIASEGQMQSRLKEREELGASFDPLEFDRFTRMQELTRFLAESLGDVITLQQGLQRNLDEAELAILQQARLNRELQQGLMAVRLVPLGNLADRFYRVVRQTSKEVGRKANLEFRGVRVDLDRSVLEKITAPFEHLLRNAVVHGIETPERRQAAGKPEIGEIVIDAVQRGNEVVLTVADDGGGLDFARIESRAREAGLLAEGATPTPAQLAAFIFLPGFSTADAVTQVAGRGVGMDVVKSEITSLGGRVELESVPGRGTTFTITLPLTLAVTQAVMLRAGPTLYAVPSVMIEQVQEYRAEAYEAPAAAGEIRWKDNRYPLRSLLGLLGQADSPLPARQIPVLLLKSGVQRAAVRVDEILGNREVVVKTIGPQLARLAGVAGATVLGNGQVVLILNPVSLVYRGSPEAAVAGAEPPRAAEPPDEPPAAEPARPARPLVMVVDDSLTVRKITSRMLARENYEIVTAKDGVDALQQLQDVRPDCILLDVEMPRMDGFEFARNMRADEATKSIPIIMITSRTADKHRNHAIELGVNEYIGKPYQEELLLSLIRRYTGESALA